MLSLLPLPLPLVRPLQVNNAGIQHISPVESFPAEKWDQIMAINLTSCFHLVRHTLPGTRMQARVGAVTVL